MRLSPVDGACAVTDTARSCASTRRREAIDREGARQFYIGLSNNGQTFNFILFRLRKNGIIFEFRVPRSEEIDQKVEKSGLESLEFSRWGYYRLSLKKADIATKRDFLKELMQAAYNNAAG